MGLGPAVGTAADFLGVDSLKTVVPGVVDPSLRLDEPLVPECCQQALPLFCHDPSATRRSRSSLPRRAVIEDEERAAPSRALGAGQVRFLRTHILGHAVGNAAAAV